MDMQCCGYAVSPYSPACQIRLGPFRLFQMLRSRFPVAADRIIFIVDEALTVWCLGFKYHQHHWCGECSCFCCFFFFATFFFVFVSYDCQWLVCDLSEADMTSITYCLCFNGDFMEVEVGSASNGFHRN
jgi:hypothetical protein